MDAHEAERVTDEAWAVVNKCEIGPWALKLFSADEDKISNFQSRSKGRLRLVSYCLFENLSIQFSQPHFLCAWHPDLFFFWVCFLEMPPVSPRKMKACFLEEGKMGNSTSSASAKIHIKSEHMHIHREFYIDAGVSCTNSFSLSQVLLIPSLALFFSIHNWIFMNSRPKFQWLAKILYWFKLKPVDWAVPLTMPFVKFPHQQTI